MAKIRQLFFNNFKYYKFIGFSKGWFSEILILLYSTRLKLQLSVIFFYSIYIFSQELRKPQKVIYFGG